MNNSDTLIATSRPSILVSRDKELALIRETIFSPGNKCRLVLIEGAGGLGKSRLMEEVLARLGDHSIRERLGIQVMRDDWTSHDPHVAGSVLLDMTDTRLHNKQEFMALLGSRESWTAELDFDDYQLVQGQLLRVRDFGISYARAKTIADEAEEAFWQCLKQNAAAQRLVVGLDTIEKLAINSSSWMMRKKLIDDADRAFQTQRWLIEHIKQGDLANVTIILAGRGDVRPGQESYFDLLKNDHELKRSADLYPIELEPLTSAETRAYFEVLLRDWTQKASTASSSEDNSSLIAMALRALLNTSERLEVLHYFTGGQPIRLALYTDILITGRTVPEPLSQPNLAAARTLVGDDSNLEAYRRKIELECARQLFHQGTDLRGRILQMLVRATRGLNEEHIHFYLDTKNDLDPRNWVSNQSRLKELRAQLQELQSLTIVKIKPDGRVGLQDEVYRIYSQSMAENPSDRKSETASRKQLYERLASLARFKLNTLKKQRATFTRDDLDNILIEKAAEALETRLPDLDSLDEKERNRINEEIFIQELEALYFAMRLDPNNFNTMFFDFANQRVQGGDSSKFTVLQSEAWLALEDQQTLSFVDTLPNPSAAERDESPIAVLLRAAQIYDATGWLIRFFMRHDYARVVELADAIDAVVAAMPAGNEKHGWNHTLSRAERGLWRGFALIYMSPGTNIRTELERLEALENDLARLVREDQFTVVFEDRGLNGERGFRDHGAEERALYTLMLLQNVIGYGYITLGEDETAIKAYVKSLQYNRFVRSSDNVHEATVRNNLARALAERGKKRSIRICRDALDLRIQKGDLVPIAYSFNTLGLILNDLYQAEEAYENCARALAIARRTQEPRLTGLVLIQLAEALRRMAKSQRSSRSRAEELYRTAENALKQAMEIFQKSSAKGEPVRVIEVSQELGCLYRDWLEITSEQDLPTHWRRYRQRGLHYFEQAQKMAGDNHRLLLDILVNQAWMYHAMDEFAMANKTIGKALALVPEGAKLRKDTPPPDPEDFPDHYFKRLSKVLVLMGMMASAKFKRQASALQQQYPQLGDKERRRLVQSDAEAEMAMQECAEAYVQALGYAQLFSARSVALSIAYDKLYDFLKTLNYSELESFYRFESAARTQFRVNEIRPADLGDLDDFLDDCFGDFSDTSLQEMLAHDN